MKKYILLCFILFFPLFAQAQQEKEKTYVVSVYYDQGIVTIQNVSIAMRFIPRQQAENEMGESKYWLELTSTEGKVLEKRLFDFNLLISAEPPDENNNYPAGSGGTFKLEQAEDEVVLPYYNNGKLVILYNLNYREIERKDISHLAVICGDGECADEEECPKDCAEEKEAVCEVNQICEAGETRENCPLDCVKNLTDKTGKTKGLWPAIITIFFIVLLVIVVIFIVLKISKHRKEKANKKENDFI